MATFVPVPLPPSSQLTDAFVKSQLTKWDLLRNMKYMVVRYTKPYHKMQGQELITDMLNDPKVQEAFQVLRSGGKWTGLGGRVTRVDANVVTASLTRLDIFDKLNESSPAIVRPNGDIAKCMDNVREGFQISDLLRDLLLNEDSENAGLYSAEERDELLWRLFEHMVLGGSCCQFEDKLEPYVETSKRLYKELVSALKDPGTGKIHVASVVYKVNAVHGESGPLELFPSKSRQNFCYVSMDPSRRLAKILYHAYVPYW
ncbi:hypothetical protein VOLCADRAFT_120268 [Volvox carteri f. nagariensis]|uniref:Cilia- and flagella-associated protein 300 n=1 Tax=Volvox carteri f. nagariensis TaxID=3068 RepID=D8TIV9_VOLCA|nr:uncharacterized protein VOLCADRAFT_120268 [Volvox carteri f. nagariensis]EFJ52435.1 hypothetical protein VOLCADRAFT_120268 [Volvox carteri f. nagariensis]|eukprot:XP_002946508.1 hypothetical protein VOLCADRAFT_120268 [Volvox carteri f. nagariensis]